jgi:hypothetical protein
VIKINIKGTIVSDGYKWIYDWFGIEAVSPKDVEKESNEANGQDIEIEINIFEQKYYVYFLVTNIAKEGSIHEGIMEIKNNNVTFKICSHDKVIKSFTGYYSISDKIIFFDLQSQSDGITYINMIKPNVNKNKYVGGLAMMMLPSDANSKPCVQKLLFSKIELDRDEYYNNLKEILSFSVDGISFGHVKVSQWEDEEAYNFILKQL